MLLSDVPTIALGGPPVANEPVPLSHAPVVLPSAVRPFVDWLTSTSIRNDGESEFDSDDDSESGIQAAWAFTDGVDASHSLSSGARRILRSLLEQAKKSRLIEFAAPDDQPTSVQPIAGKLFAAYRVDGGHLQLAGCQVDDHLVCRCERPNGTHDFFSIAGDHLPDHVISAIGLESLSPSEITADLDSHEAALAASAALTHAATTGATVRRMTLIRCRHVSGKVRFTIGNVSCDLPFSGWAGDCEPPPFVCPHTGARSFHIAATDDGRIAAAEEIAVCRHSGRRLLRQELVRCAVTGAYVLPEYAAECPVTGEQLEQSAFVECTHCRQSVSPHAIEGERCSACRSLQALKADDLQMSRILNEYPNLTTWRHWRFAQTSQVYILEAQGLWQRLLAVIDRHTLACRHAAIRGRWPAAWKDLSSDQMRDVLGKREA